LICCGFVVTCTSRTTNRRNGVCPYRSKWRQRTKYGENARPDL